MNEFQDDDWDPLLDYIEAEKVIPIIGSDLVTVQAGGGEIPFSRHVAGLLAPGLRVPVAQLPPEYSLNDVVSRFLESKNSKKKDVYQKIWALLKDATFPPSQCLLDLASIERFNLFVSTTFDPLLANAINATRFGGNAKTEVLAYTPSDVPDLKSDKKSLERPVVYHLLGKLSALPGYAVCDEDVLEFLHAMQSESRQPKLLFDELKDNSLLILGCSFADWLSRFFIRLAKSQQLSFPRDHMEILVDAKAVRDENLISFLEHFSSETKIFAGTPAEFVTELTRRWRERHPAEEAQAAPAAAPAEAGADSTQMEKGAIFLSYASDDLEAVERIKTALEKAGLDVWFDRKRLETGDDWDQKIRRNIANCSLCVPVVSRATDARPEGYFRREWRWAVDRAEGIADEVPFIVPVTVDDTAAYTAKVPERFKKTQWAELRDGQVPPEFAEKLKQLVRDFHKRQRAA